MIGRTSITETGVYSVYCAIQNLWLAARAEGIGVGWVSILANEDLQKILLIPKHVKPIAYLCLGYVKEFAEKPELEKKGWFPRMELSNVICYEQWGVSTFYPDENFVVLLIIKPITSLNRKSIC